MEKNEKIKMMTDLLLSLNNGDIVYVDKDQLSLIRSIVDALEYRNSVAVTEYIRYPANIGGFSPTFEICPKCAAVLSRTYQEYCSSCGQRLRWISTRKMKLIPPTNKSN